MKNPRATIFSRYRIASCLLGACLVLMAGLVLVWLITGRGGDRQSSTYVGSNSCIACHAAQHELWRDSHHALAQAEATPENVLGDFNDAEFEHLGVKSRFFRKDGGFFVHTQGPEGRMADFQVKHTFGVAPLQQYLVELGGGRLQALTIAWDSRAGEAGGQKWFHLQGQEKIEPADPLHWTQRSYNWNSRCAVCHVTDYHKGYDLATDTYRSHFAQAGVACESCHGPGSGHVQWAQAGSAARWWMDIPRKGLAGGPAHEMDGQALARLDNCMRCHSRRQPITEDDPPGEPFLDHHMPVLLRQDLYSPDGQMEDEVYNHGSFLQSRMHAKGVRCTDCHDPHSGQRLAPGNLLCVRCHNSTPPPAYSSIRGAEYDSPAHHFHKPGSTGASCTACHMPSKTYMEVDPRLDHSFRVPRPDLSLKLGLPNACNDCHTDHDAAWSAKAMEEWYGPVEGPPHFALAFAAGRRESRSAGPALAGLLRDPGQSSMVRATAAELLRSIGGPEALELFAQGVKDPDPLVRISSAGALEGLDPRTRIQTLAPLLEDPIRAVRIEAARVLGSDQVLALLDVRQRTWLEKGLAEYRDSQMAVADQAPAHLNLGALHANLGLHAQAMGDLENAIRLDETGLYAAQARLGMARLHAGRGAVKEAEALLRGVAGLANPVGIPKAAWQGQRGEALYDLGLLLGQDPQRIGESAQALGQAALHLPGQWRVHYNHGLALGSAGDGGQAEEALLRALRLAEDDYDVLFALAAVCRDHGRMNQALAYARKLVQIYPQSSDGLALLDDISRKMPKE